MPLTIKPRNPLAFSPLLRKGGAHSKSNSAIRQGSRASLTQNLGDWEEELAFERELKSTRGGGDQSDDQLKKE